MRIAFTYTKGNLFSKLVTSSTDSEWSHCFVIVDKIGEDYLIMESSFFGGVKFDLLSKYINKNVRCEIYEFDDGHDCLDALVPFIGKNYGYFQSLGYLVMKLFKLEKNPFTSGLWCSEYVLMCLLHGNLSDKFSHLSPNSTTPEDLYKIISKDKNFKKIN